ncbi:unnamed protein product [Rotaria socialis]
MKKRIDKLFFVFKIEKNNQLEYTEEVSCFINDHVQKVNGCYHFKNQGKFEKMLIGVVDQINTFFTIIIIILINIFNSCNIN